MFVIGVLLTLLGLGLTLPFTGWKWYWKLIAGTVMTLIVFKFQIFHLIASDAFSPDIPRWLQVVSGGAFAAFFIMTLLVTVNILINIFILLLRKICGKKYKSFRKYSAAGNYFCAAAAVCISTLGCINGLKMPIVREQKLFFPDLPAAAEGLRIAVVADLHITYTTNSDYVAETVKKVNNARPHIVVFTGDNADGKCADLGKKFEAIKYIDAPLGMWGVTGNHEYYQGNKALDEWLDFYNEHGLQMLFNSSAAFPEHGFVLGGVPDRTANGRHPLTQDFGKVFDGQENDLFRIILVHRPDGAAESSRINSNLQISGHTHGGMLPGLKMLVSLFNDGMASGIFRKYGITVAVSNGTGIWSGFPLRVNCPTEIMILELHKGENYE